MGWVIHKGCHENTHIVFGHTSHFSKIFIPRVPPPMSLPPRSRCPHPCLRDLGPRWLVVPFPAAGFGGTPFCCTYTRGIVAPLLAVESNLVPGPVGMNQALWRRHGRGNRKELLGVQDCKEALLCWKQRAFFYPSPWTHQPTPPWEGISETLSQEILLGR